MHRITNYKTVVSQGTNSTAWLDAAVCVSIKDGWQPYGGPYMNSDRCLCQAMVKYDEAMTPMPRYVGDQQWNSKEARQ